MLRFAVGLALARATVAQAQSAADAGETGVGDAGPADAGRTDAGPADAGPADPGLIVDLPLDADAPQVAAAAENGEAPLGAPFTVFVTATARAGVQVSLRDPLELGAAFEVRRKLASSRPLADGGTAFEWQLELVAWEVGDLRIPPIPLLFTSHGRAGQITTAPAPMRILGSLAEDDDGTRPRGLSPPRPLLRPRPWWPWVAGGAAALALLGLLGLLWWRTRRRAKPASGPTRSRWRAHREGPGGRALRRLAALEASGALITQQKAGYTELADVLRELLGAVGGFPTKDLTTGELTRALAQHPTLAGAAEDVTRWLAAVDKVKYAAYVATEREAAAALADARSLVLVLAADLATDLAPDLATDLAPAPAEDPSAAPPAPVHAPAHAPAPANDQPGPEAPP